MPSNSGRQSTTTPDTASSAQMHNVLFCRTPRMQQRTEQTVKKIALGDCAAREGNLLEAKKIFSSLLNVAPSDVEVCVKLSVIEKRLGNTKQAEFLAKKSGSVPTQAGILAPRSRTGAAQPGETRGSQSGIRGGSSSATGIHRHSLPAWDDRQ